VANFQEIHYKLGLYERLMRLDKPIGILLLLWPTLWALWFSSYGTPDWRVVWIFVLGTVLMRSAGCVMNDIADRDFDSQVARTRERPLATGEATLKEALILAGVLVICSFILILPFRSWHLIGWSAVALFLAATYPLTKRFFAVPQAYLGIAFGFGIPMAYVAQLDMIPRVAWWLLLANIFWAMAYDTEYAMVDRADDLKIGIRTSAITFGRFDVAAVMLCYALTLALIGWVGHMLQRGGVFYAGLVAAAAVALYHYTLIRRREPARCFKAFLHNNWFGACIFAGIVVDYLRQA
jgi:4-hydroxybenzoate polyprenyltransferase